jgi:hypothetical protein
MRSKLAIPATAMVNIHAITDDSTCAAAAAAISSAVGEAPPSGRSVLVVQVDSVFVVQDRALKAGHFDLYFVFNSTLETLLSKYVS